MKLLPESTTSNWSKFVLGHLATTNEKNVLLPASTYNSNMSSSGEEDDLEAQFPQDTSLQQMFSDYQMQRMSEHFIDSFGFSEDGKDESG